MKYIVETPAITTYEVKAKLGISHQDTWVCETYAEAVKTIATLEPIGWTDFQVFRTTTTEIKEVEA